MNNQLKATTTSKEIKAMIRQMEEMLEKLKSEVKDELSRTKENFEDYFVIKKFNGKVSIHVSKLGRSELVKERLKQVSDGFRS
jgi:hypothetical protein